MKIAQRWEAVSDWLNADLKARRIDAVLLLMGVGIGAYYWLFYDWKTMVLGVLMYLLVILISVWML